MSEEATLDDFVNKQGESGSSSANADWFTNELDQVADITMGSSPKSEYYNDEGDGLPFFQANDEFGFRSPTHDRWCSNPRKIAHPGDSLMTLRGTYVGQMNIADRKCCIGRGLAAITPGKRMESEFLFQYLNYIEPYVRSIAIGSTFDSVSSADVQSLEIDVPPIQEQRRIASVLYNIDQAIQKTNSIREQLIRGRKGVFQSVFEKGVRDVDTKPVRLLSIDTRIPEHWDVVSVEEISTLITDGAHLTPEKSESGYYLLGARNVQNGYVDLEDADYVSEDEYQRLIDKCHPECDDILMSCRGVGLGRIALVPDGLECALLCSAALIKLERSVHPEYIEKVLRHVDIQKQITALQTQSAQPNLFQNEIASLELPLPPTEEQKEIARLLSGFDEQIEFEEMYQQQLKRLKQSLGQDLLSGKVRTTDTNIEVLPDIEQYG